MKKPEKKKWSLKAVLKELVWMAVLVFVMANVISYLKKPDIQSEQLPQIQERLIDGQVFSTDSLDGKPLLVHFWATWCPTCKAEAGNIETLSKHFDILSIAVKSGSDADLRAYMNERELTFNVLNDTQRAYADAFAVGVFPTTYIFNAKGELVFTEVGYTSTIGLYLRMWWAQ